MSLTNRDIAQIFENIADILEIQGESRFRFLSYRRAAETISELQRDLRAHAADGTLQDLPGIGKAIADKIEELLETGQLGYYEKRKAEVPLGVLDIKRINGVGPKKAKLFWEELNITSVEALQEAAEAGQLRQLSGMGKKSEQKIIDGIQALKRRSGRMPIGRAKPEAERILSALLALPDAKEGVIAGSLRRGRDTIGDVDILIASDHAEPIMTAFVAMDGIARVLGQGATKSSVELNSGLQVDVRVLPAYKWGTALQYFTGSQAHNVKIREIARQQGYSLNEDALRPLDEDGNISEDEREYRYFEHEADLYEALGLRWIPPELREDAGEIEQARQAALPRLIEIEQIRGDLHMHTTYSDGKLSIREMAHAARQRGRQYVVITDHSQASAQAGGLSPADVRAQQAEVRRINAEMGEDFHVLHGTEMDIKPDGTLDFDDALLRELDFVVASLHFSLQQDQDQIMTRLLTAIRNPHVDCIAHLTGRLIGKRDPAKVDIDVIIREAVAHNTLLEINANPARLDINAEYARMATRQGVTLAINTDAHSDHDMDTLPYGILTARRGWVEPEQVINTWDYAQFTAWLSQHG